MDPDTRIGGPQNRFPETRGSILLQLNATDCEIRSRAWDTIASVYWKPLYAYQRFRWKLSNEDAKDLIQGFFQHVVEKDCLTAYDESQASFRTFLRLCFDRYSANEWKSAQRIKRGGAVRMETLDDAVPAAADVEALFHREWIRNVFALSVAELKHQASEAQFEVFSRYDLSDPNLRPTYSQLSEALGLPATTITNHLAAMRRRLRQIVLQKLRELTATDREYRNEARAVLGIEVE